MGLRVTQKRLIGALMLCGALLGCIREDALYPVLNSLPMAPQTVTPVIRVNQKPLEIPPPKEPENEVAEETSPPPASATSEDPPQTLPAQQTIETQQMPAESEPKPEEPKIAEKPAKKIPGVHTYFVNREVRSANIKMFPRWTGMLTRYNTENHSLDGVCGSERDQPCKLKGWKDFLEGLKDAPLLEQITEVNRYLNKYPYIDDILNYWETPYEFQRKSGNCKDYAIAKFLSLRALGVPNDVMRITVLRDLNLGGVIHAVLVVTVDEKNYILDNQIKQVISTDKVYHYVPIYSINEDHWWQHFMLE